MDNEQLQRELMRTQIALNKARLDELNRPSTLQRIVTTGHGRMVDIEASASRLVERLRIGTWQDRAARMIALTLGGVAVWLSAAIIGIV